jgi:hypothetical protein
MQLTSSRLGAGVRELGDAVLGLVAERARGGR